MASSLYLVADLTGRKALTSIGGGAFSFPTFTGGEEISLSLTFQQTLAGSAIQTFPNLRSIRASIGLPDAASYNGSFALQVGIGISTVANTTGDLNYNVDQRGLQDALNSLTCLSGVKALVWTDGNAFVVVFSDGQQREIFAVRNDLDPSSTIRVRTNSLSEAVEHEITILQTPIASSDAFASIVPDAPSVSLVEAAYTDPSGVFKYPCIQNITVPLNFLGTYQISYNYLRTTSLSTADGISVIQAAINSLFTLPGQTVTVTNPSPGVAQVSFDGSAFVGIGQPLFVISVVTAPPGSPTISLSLDNPSCYAVLRRADQLKGYFLEVVADICEEGVDPSTASTWQTVSLFRAPVVIQRPINWIGLEASTPIDWVNPPGPTDYIPRGQNNIITGQQFYVQPIGNATATNFNITHNLGTQAVHLTLVNNEASGSIMVNGTDYTAAANTTATVQIATASVHGSSGVLVVISSAGPKAAFMDGLTVTTAQVEGLVAQLNGLESTVTELSALLPALSTSGAGSAASVNAVTIPLQQTSEVIGYKGPALTADPFLGLKEEQLVVPHLLTPSAKFDRELWRVGINDKMFALGRTLQAAWGVSLQLLKANCAAEYKLVAEIGTYADVGSSPIHSVITWASDPIFSQPLVMTKEMVIHSFGLTLKRGIVSSVDTITLDQIIYGIATGNNGAVPANANFFLRCRLLGLETESVDPAKGIISIAVVPVPDSASTTPSVIISS